MLVFESNGALDVQLGLLGPVIRSIESSFSTDIPLNRRWGRLSAKEDIIDNSKLLSYLNGPISKVVIPFPLISMKGIQEVCELLVGVDRERVVVEFKASPEDYKSGPNFKSLSEYVGGFIVVEPLDVSVVVGLISGIPSSDFYISTVDVSLATELYGKGVSVVAQVSSVEEAASLYLSICSSDRIDGLISTIVTDELGIALGLCYSDIKSLIEAVKGGKGVYMSRKRGLWVKGLSSGNTQKLLSVSLDCDGDCLMFKVVQKGGFCHLGSRSCFGDVGGLSQLYSTLKSRLDTKVEGSYTQRLFNDSKLLNSKIVEEAQELCEARGVEDVKFEMADLVYFGLVKCVLEGVTLRDVEDSLELKSLKVIRRAGDAKSNIELVEGYRMKVYKNSQISSQERAQLLLRPIINTAEILSKVVPIMSKVRLEGDSAILQFTAQFDKVHLSVEEMTLKAPFDASLMVLPADVKSAIDLAFDNIEKFHRAQLEAPLEVETMPGVICRRFTRPIERVGLYVPGGTAVLPSTTLMLGIPAMVAQCPFITIATPPRLDGSVAPEVVYVAHKVGACMILKAGGAQAVAALAYGTESVQKVDKVCGPGNQFVTAAKMVAQGDSTALLGIDMPAGPSELLVIADQNANISFVVSDLLSQAEHGRDSQVVLLLISDDLSLIKDYERELETQSQVLERREIVSVSLSKSYILLFSTLGEAIAFSNEYAPEHLILNVTNASAVVSQITNAGSIFVGAFSPESCGDYASGTNHTLPTYGYARMYSGVSTSTFLKYITSQELSRGGLEGLGKAVMRLAEVEGLGAHRNAVQVRLDALL